ncbi:NAD-dependent histone deacetylase Sir2 [Aduncisulcus paluster]|uniref:NAD-dependent histone deacetylase Sir2 n=1 Tax=Aduncisulcus paluster TaxID=2918883 RepID=A0ABQ5KQF0_9EUKA|nr:NAD-dependent histone deacetylase Sir2 [Aduncisulcus paluster]
MSSEDFSDTKMFAKIRSLMEDGVFPHLLSHESSKETEEEEDDIFTFGDDHKFNPDPSSATPDSWSSDDRVFEVRKRHAAPLLFTLPKSEEEDEESELIDEEMKKRVKNLEKKTSFSIVEDTSKPTFAFTGGADVLREMEPSDADETSELILGKPVPESSLASLRLINPTRFKAWLITLKKSGVSPFTIIRSLGLDLPPDIVPKAVAWAFLDEVVLELAEARCPRQRLGTVNTLDDAALILRHARNVVMLTGAGISVACGIPDFRSKNGLYARLGEWDGLNEPTDMFSLPFFRDNPIPFYKFAKELLPGQFNPSFTHHFISEIDRRGRLLRNYTQNIDGLEKTAGVKRYLQCHGTFDTCRCLTCGRKWNTMEKIKHHILNQRVPLCEFCSGGKDFWEHASPGVKPPQGVIKPDIVFFSEQLPELFDLFVDEDCTRVDCVIVMGSSLKVKPVAGLLGRVPRYIPQILINREIVGRPHAFDLCLLGDCDTVCFELACRMGWRDLVEERGDLVKKKRAGIPGSESGPDIVFFSEQLPELFDLFVDEDCTRVDCVIVMGSSLKVKPVAGLLGRVPRYIPQILINREIVGRPHAFDLCLLGDCDTVCFELACRMGWRDLVEERGDLVKKKRAGIPGSESGVFKF